MVLVPTFCGGTGTCGYQLGSFPRFGIVPLHNGLGSLELPHKSGSLRILVLTREISEGSNG